MAPALGAAGPPYATRSAVAPLARLRPADFIATEYLRWTRQSDCILVVGTKCTMDQKGRTGTLGNAVLS